MARHARRRAVPRLHLGDRRRPTPATPIRGSWRRSRRRRRSSSTASRTSSTTSPGCASTSGCARLLPGGPWQALPVEQRRGGGRGGGQARPGRDRPAGDHRVPLRLPRPDRPGDGADRGQGRLPRRRSSRCPGSVYHAAYPYCYRAAGGPHDPAACTCDWEERLDLLFHQLVYPDKVAAIIVEPVIGEGGYIVPPPDVPAAAPRDHPRARHPARRGRGPDGLRADRRAVRRPALGRRARHHRHGQGHRVGAAAVGHPGASASCMAAWRPGPTAGRTAATSSPAPPRSRRSTSSRTRGWSRTPRERGAQLLDGLRRIAGRDAVDRRRARARADGRAGVREARRGRRPRPGPGPRQAGAAGGASRASCSCSRRART